MFIPFLVFLELGSPVGFVGFGNIGKFATMLVPEASPDLNGCFMLFHHYVGFSRKLFVMKPEPVAKTVQIFANNDFWLGVPGPNPGHNSGALLN